MAGQAQHEGPAGIVHGGAEFKNLMAGIGYLMFHWSQIDVAVFEEIKRLRMSEGEHNGTSSKARGTFSERLAEWQALVSQKSRRNPQALNRLSDLARQAELLNRKRKLFVQNFTGASGINQNNDLAIYASEGGITAPRSAQSRLTQVELEALIDEIRQCQSGIEGLLSMP